MEKLATQIDTQEMLVIIQVRQDPSCWSVGEEELLCQCVVNGSDTQIGLGWQLLD